MMTVRKNRAATQSFGRGSDNYRTPAGYAVLDATGATVGIILGSRAGYMQKSRWEVCWLSPTGMPRTVHQADSFAAAKAWAQTWDGQAPIQWRNA
jgi:hypothetical protein